MRPKFVYISAAVIAVVVVLTGLLIHDGSEGRAPEPPTSPSTPRVAIEKPIPMDREVRATPTTPPLEKLVIPRTVDEL